LKDDLEMCEGFDLNGCVASLGLYEGMRKTTNKLSLAE
jgi:hypothetical protein